MGNTRADPTVQNPVLSGKARKRRRSSIFYGPQQHGLSWGKNLPALPVLRLPPHLRQTAWSQAFPGISQPAPSKSLTKGTPFSEAHLLPLFGDGTYCTRGSPAPPWGSTTGKFEENALAWAPTASTLHFHLAEGRTQDRQGFTIPKGCVSLSLFFNNLE